MAVTGYFEHSPPHENGENLAYFEPTGNRNYIAATQTWLEEKQFYHGQVLTAKPRYEAEEGRQEQWGITWPSSGQK
jgi:hypothetical protein